jgi:hypothetical protein
MGQLDRGRSQFGLEEVTEQMRYRYVVARFTDELLIKLF